MGRFEVFQNLYVVGVDDTPSTLVVRVRDGVGADHTIEYHFDAADREPHREVLEGWRTWATPLTYVRQGRQGSLLDDEAEFWQAYA